MNRHKLVFPLLFASLATADSALAQCYTSSGGFSFTSTSGRIIVMLVGTGLGFGLGWCMTPAAKDFRGTFALVIFGAIGLLALIDNGLPGIAAAWIFAAIGFFVGVGYWAAVGLGSFMQPPTTFGSSRWAQLDDIDEYDLYGNDGIRLGQAFGKNGEESISYKGDRHLLTVAPTRAGKGTTQIIPNLLTYEGSMLVIDPKGENALITAKRRQEMGQEVHIVDPWGIANVDGIEPSSFNPLDWLDLGDVDITENAMILADALVGKMMSSSHPIVSSTGARSLQKDRKLLSNVLAAAQAQTHFLDSSRLRDNLMTSSFKFEDLKTKPMTIYLVLPADRLSTFGR